MKHTFLTELHEIRNGSRIDRCYRMFESLPLGGGWELSAQNSPGHYVANRWDANFDWDRLDSFEVAIVRPSHQYRDPLDNHLLPLHASKHVLKRIGSLIGYGGTVRDEPYVKGWLTRDEVQIMLNELRDMFGYAR